MAVTPKDLWATVKGLLIEQYRGNLREEIESGTYVDEEGVERHYELPEGADNRLQGVLKAVLDELLQPVDDAAVDIGQLADVSQAEGEWLDVLGKLAGLQRYYQESDRDFRVRVEAALASDNAGTPDNVIYNAAILSGDPHPQYMDEAPATFLVYDGPRPKANGGGSEPVYNYTLLLNWVENYGPDPTWIGYGNDWKVITEYISGMDDPEDYDWNNLEQNYFTSKTPGDRLCDPRNPVDFSSYGITGSTPFGLVTWYNAYDDFVSRYSDAIDMSNGGKFTLEFWYAMSPSAINKEYGTSYLFNLHGENSGFSYLILEYNHGSNQLTFEGEITTTVPFDKTVYGTDWHHYAVTCDGDTFYLFIDGVKKLERVLSSQEKTGITNLSDYEFNTEGIGYTPWGRFAQIAICSECKWTSDFTPPTTAYTATPTEEWEQGGHQLSRSQVRKLAPAGVLGLPGAALQDAEGNYIVDAEGKLILLVADDENIEREVLLADNLGNIVITPQSVPVRVKLTGPTVPTIPVIETEWNGVPVDAVRIKDLPDGADTNGYMVRDSDTEGTVKSRAMDEAALDELWDSTPAEGEEG